MFAQAQLSSGKTFVPPSDPRDLRMLVLKLRWMGLDSEAERLTRVLMRTAPAECSLIGPIDTD